MRIAHGVRSALEQIGDALMRYFSVPAVLVAMFVSMPTGAAAATIILNGSFENNAAVATMFNMTNPTFNATVADATAFGNSSGIGDLGEIDLVTSTDFGIAPQDGDWKLGLHEQSLGGQDAFSMSLTEGIVGGSTYDLQFYGALLGGSPTGTLEIGVSNSATSFGTLVFSGTPLSADSWTLFSALFVAPSNAAFLTVRVTGTDGYAFVDNFTLESTASAVPEPATLSLFGIGAAAAGLRRWRRSK
jgi:hypothetical protein